MATTTAPVTVDTTATDPAALDQAMVRIASYARTQTGGLVNSTQTLEAAIAAGSVPRAKAAYAAARPYYERIEPLVALFPELDGKIDAREDAFPKGARDPDWTGFHPIERAIYRDGEIDARTKLLARGLVTDSRRLDELMQDTAVPPEVVIPGVAELVDEIEESKITGEEERYSKLDLPTFLANLEGSRAFYTRARAAGGGRGPRARSADRRGLRRRVRGSRGAAQGRRLRGLRRPQRRPAESDKADDRGPSRAACPGPGHPRRGVMTELSRRRLLQGAAGGGAAVAAGTLGLPRLTGSDHEARADDGLVPWRGTHQAGIVSARTEYAMAAAFEVVDDDLPGLLSDLTGRIAELTRGFPDRLDSLDNAALPPSDTGELGYDRRTTGD